MTKSPGFILLCLGHLKVSLGKISIFRSLLIDFLTLLFIAFYLRYSMLYLACCSFLPLVTLSHSSHLPLSSSLLSFLMEQYLLCVSFHVAPPTNILIPFFQVWMKVKAWSTLEGKRLLFRNNSSVISYFLLEIPNMDLTSCSIGFTYVPFPPLPLGHLSLPLAQGHSKCLPSLHFA